MFLKIKNVFFKFQNVSSRIILLVYGIILLMIMTIRIESWKNSKEKLSTYLIILSFTLIIILLKVLLNKNDHNIKDNRYILPILIVICFIVKFLWIYNFRIEPKQDYEIFLKTAVDISNNDNIRFSRYIGLFPHIFGYSFFLGQIFKIFGTGELIHQITNVVLSCISMTMIFKINKNIFNNKSAILGAIIWIFLPSQTIYNMFSLSEPLYTTLILIALYISFKIIDGYKNISDIKLILGSILLGIILSYVNITRPIAIIVIIANLIYIFFLNINNNKKKLYCMKMSSLILIAVGVYFMCGMFFNYYIENRIDERLAKTPGTTIYFGFNTKSRGMWNEEDSTKLSKLELKNEDMPAKEIQERMFSLAKKRAVNDIENYPEFMYEKFEVLWGADSAAVWYGDDSFKKEEKISFNKLSDTYYFAIVFLSFLNTIRLFLLREKNRYYLVPMLFLIGLTIAHSVAEVAGRYHYSGMITIVIISSILFEKKSREKATVNKLL